MKLTFVIGCNLKVFLDPNHYPCLKGGVGVRSRILSFKITRLGTNRTKLAAVKLFLIVSDLKALICVGG